MEPKLAHTPARRHSQKTKNEQKCGRTSGRTAAGQVAGQLVRPRGRTAGQRPDKTPPHKGPDPKKKSDQSSEVAPALRFEGAAIFLRAGPAMKTARFGASFFLIKPFFLSSFLRLGGLTPEPPLRRPKRATPFRTRVETITKIAEDSPEDRLAKELLTALLEVYFI